MAGKKPPADSLNFVRPGWSAGEDCAVCRLDGHRLERRLLWFYVFADAGERPARADAGDQKIGALAISSSAFRMAPFIPRGPGVRTISAPKASSSTRRSRLMVSGMVRMSLYPFTAATKGSAIPVLPRVGSIRTVSPG